MAIARIFWLLLSVALPGARVDSPVLLEAQRINHSVTSTSYSHRAIVDESAGVYRVDCSIFVGLVLSHVSPAALQEIPKESRHKYPRAFSFADFFRGIAPDDPYWTSIKRLSDAAPGDIIAWRMLKLEPGKDTGHVAILESVPQKLDDQTFSVEVVDASEVRHFSDSRMDGKTGVGTGRLLIRIDEHGEPTEAKFNEKSNWHPHLFGIGRFKS